MLKNPQECRKWQITINNPIEHGYDHQKIKELLASLKPCIYWAMADEKGTCYHTHIFIACSSAVRFSRLQKMFDIAHLEPVKGSAQQNRDYITKSGKWENSDKHETSIPGTFEEWGELPPDRYSGDTDYHTLYAMVQDGLSNGEIISTQPTMIAYIDKVDRVRTAIQSDQFKTTWRDIKTAYVFGPTGCGKTRGILEHFEYPNVFRVTNYGNGAFDGYHGQNVLLFEEFRAVSHGTIDKKSCFSLSEMLNYLDSYPIDLPARYSNRTAAYTYAFITSNLPLEKQYLSEQLHDPASWAAFLRRINYVVVYDSSGDHKVFSTEDYMAHEVCPFI